MPGAWTEVELHNHAGERDMSDAFATMKSEILCALADTSQQTRLTVDRCDGVPERIIEYLFDPSVRWAVEEYLKETGDAKA